MKQINGISVLFRAGGIILRTPRLRKLAVMPVIVSLIAVTIGVPILLWFAPGWFDALFPDPASADASLAVSGLRTIGKILFVIGVGAVGGVILMLLGRALAAPAMSTLSAGIEEIASGRAHADSRGSVTAFVADTGGAIATALGRLLLFLLFYPLIFATQLIPIAGVIIFPVLSALYGAFALGFDFSEPAWERHLPGFRNRVAFMRRHSGRYLLFGLASLGMMLIPFVNILLIPVGVGGGTLLVNDIRRDEQEGMSQREEG